MENYPAGSYRGNDIPRGNSVKGLSKILHIT